MSYFMLNSGLDTATKIQSRSSIRSMLLPAAMILACLGGYATVQAMEALPESAPVPPSNPMSPAKISLGRKLFFDPRLSKDGSVSCASCHNVLKNGEDGAAFSKGVGGKLGGRSSPTVFNAAFNSVQFWDGRAATLEDQAIGPMINPVEMAMTSHDLVVERLRKIPGYGPEFQAALATKMRSRSVALPRPSQPMNAR